MKLLSKSAFATFVSILPSRPKPRSQLELLSLELPDRSATLFFSESLMVICLDTINPSSSTSSIFPKLKKHLRELLWNSEIVLFLFFKESFALMTSKPVFLKSLRIQ